MSSESDFNQTQTGHRLKMPSVTGEQGLVHRNCAGPDPQIILSDLFPSFSQLKSSAKMGIGIDNFRNFRQMQPQTKKSKPNQKRRVGNHIHGFSFTDVRFSTASSKRAFPAQSPVCFVCTNDTREPRVPRAGMTRFTTEEKESVVPFFQDFNR